MPNNKKIILGFTGLLSSGKGAAAKYVEDKYAASTYRFSTMLRDLTGRMYLEQSRDNLIKMSEAIRTTFGEDIMAKVIAQDVTRDKNQIIIVEGIRRMADIAYLSDLPNFILVEIFADPKIRYERLLKRGENSDDATKTYEQFLADHKRSTEITIPEVAEHATEHINNNGTCADLREQIDNIITRISADKKNTHEN